jgi:hypothetical protein
MIAIHRDQPGMRDELLRRGHGSGSPKRCCWPTTNGSRPCWRLRACQRSSPTAARSSLSHERRWQSTASGALAPPSTPRTGGERRQRPRSAGSARTAARSWPAGRARGDADSRGPRTTGRPRCAATPLDIRSRWCARRRCGGGGCGIRTRRPRAVVARRGRQRRCARQQWLTANRASSAAWNGDLAMVTLLVAAGADPTARDHQYDATPRGWAEISTVVTNNPACAAVAAFLATLDND